MLTFLRKHSILICMLFLATILFSVRQWPSATRMLAGSLLIFSLALSISSIFEKHKSVSSPIEARRRILKDVLLLVLVLALAMVLGGIAGSFAGVYTSGYVEPRWQGFGIMAGFIAALAVSFAVGYGVRCGMRKAFRS